MASISTDLKRKRVRGYFKSKIKGIAIIEFTVVVSLFFALFLTVVDLGIYGFVKLTMQHSAREGARYAITGRSDLDPDASSNREAAILEKISQSSSGLLDKVIRARIYFVNLM